MKNPKQKLKITTLLLSLILVLSVFPVYATNGNDPEWPQSSYNSEQNGQSPYSGPQRNNTPKWNFTVESPDTPIEPTSSPVVDSEGIAYFTGAYHTAEPADFKTYLYAVYPNGTQKFNTTFANWLGGCSIGPDGTLYVTGWLEGENKLNQFFTPLQYLFARNSDGTPKWNFTYPDCWNFLNPVVTSDGTIYFGTPQSITPPTKGIYWAFNPDGTQKWNFTPELMPNDLCGYAVDDINGISYLGYSERVPDLRVGFTQRQTTLYAVDSAGKELWNLVMDIPEGLILFSPAIGPNGMIYAILSAASPVKEVNEGSNDPPGTRTYVVAVNPDGTPAWRYDVPGEAIQSEKSTSSLAIAADGTIYFGTVVRGYIVGNGTFFALNPDGTQKWNYTSPNDLPFSTPIIDSDGTIYTTNSVPFYGENGEGQAAGEGVPPEPISKLFAFNPDGTIKWALDNIISSYPAALTKNGTMYLSSLIPGMQPPPPPEEGSAGEPVTAPYANSPTKAVLYQIEDQMCELYLQVASSNLNPTVGDIITLTFKVGNRAQDSAQGTVLTWTLPAGLEIVGSPWSDTQNQPVYDPTTRTITWDLGTVPYGDPYMWTNTRVLSAGIINVQAALTTLTYDPNIQQNIQILAINAQATSSNLGINAQTTSKTVGMQTTGIPLAGIILAVLMLMCGLLSVRKK